MNRDQLEGQFKQLKGAMRKEWGRLTHNERDIDEGERDRLSGRMQKTYGIRQQEAQRQIRELKSRY